MYEAWIVCEIFNVISQICLITIIWSISHKIHFDDEPISYYSSENFENVLIDGSEVGGHFSTGTVVKSMKNTPMLKDQKM